MRLPFFPRCGEGRPPAPARIAWLPLLAVSFHAACAQEAGPRPDTVYTLDEVVSTASRSDLPLFKIPAAVTVLKLDPTRQLAGLGTDNLLLGIPGLFAQSRSGAQDVRLTIRGFGARGAGERSNAGTSRGIRILLDGFPLTEPDGRTSLDFLEPGGMGRVEVVRSNASAVWGNASGGIVSFMPPDVGADPYARVQVSAGSFGFLTSRAEAGLPLGSGSLLLSLGTGGTDGWREHSRGTADHMNAVFTGPVAQDTRLFLSLRTAHTAWQIPGALTPSQFADDPSQAQDDPSVYSPTYVERDERRDNRLLRVAARLTHHFAEATELSAGVFVEPKSIQRSERNTIRDFTRYHLGGNATFNHAFPLSRDISTTIRLGVDQALQDGELLFFDIVDGGRGPLRSNRRERAMNAGAFAVDELAIGDDWEISIGGRFDLVRYETETRYDASGAPLVADSRDFTHVTPRIGVSYSLSGGHVVYANIGGGIEVPAGNETDPPPVAGEDTLYGINPLLEPGISTTLEAGTKHVLSFGAGAFVRVMSYEAALYAIRTRNDLVPYRGGRFYLSAGESRRIGAEVALSMKLAGDVALDGSLAVSRNTYVDYRIDSAYYGKPGVTSDFAGNDLPGVPGLLYFARLRKSFPDVGSAYAEIVATGANRYPADDQNAAFVPPYAVFHVTVGATSIPLVGDRLVGFTSLSVKNLAGRTYAASGWINPDISAAGEPVYLEAGLPGEFAATAGVTWRF